MAKRAGAYKSEKRKKELQRQKKQEEKRLKRLKKADGTEEVVADETAETDGAEPSADAPQEAAGEQE